MNETEYYTLDDLIASAEDMGFTVQVADGPRVSYITGTKQDGPAIVVFAASASDRVNGTLDLRAQFLASDGEQGTVTTLRELVDWVCAN